MGDLDDFEDLAPWLIGTIFVIVFIGIIYAIRQYYRNKAKRAIQMSQAVNAVAPVQNHQTNVSRETAVSVVIPDAPPAYDDLVKEDQNARKSDEEINC
ncbi:Oidioi.mRNA.OKI2018_I69.chr1.g326.t1.cds [Oikopleura dioica]|uniref:Oidioi.mRNA.OKI2018_I69.chr1.g326.t1.cds n=1 Tax=Oikopleura dioica TaxID=34765 RepID=A0ABN7SJH0_OIKDI|nr:Oidioi.mRNA.OKI2018_I69.chr1.g326.t1.cds [Oikopleura dioica]